MAVGMLGVGVCAVRGDEVYKDVKAPVEARVEDLLGRLTLEEKVGLVHGDSKFSTAGVERLGILRRWMSDGPHGVREEIGPDTWEPQHRTDDYATYMPAGIALAATWNPGLAHAEGAAIGEEARARGKDIMLGPGVNMMRTPLCGRNFEYMGEDPYLTSRMAVGYIQGEQSEGVASCVKHFAANNQEADRQHVDVEMDERTLREIYLPAFHAAVTEGGAWAVMGAYNRFRGAFCSENDYLLNGVLKGEWGFKGIVISDWGAVHDTAGAVNGGLDVEMGTSKRYEDFYMAGPYLAGLRDGTYAMKGLDEKVRRTLRVMIATHVLDGDRPAGAMNTEGHERTARAVAEEGMVLLKNEGGALPLDASKVRKVAVIGENAMRLQAHGGESSAIKAYYEVTPLEGIERRAGDGVSVSYSPGYGSGKDVDDAQAQELRDDAVKAAGEADVAIIVGGLNHEPGMDCEGSDRTDLKLPYGQEELIREVAAVNRRTIVVLMGTVVEMGGWVGKTPAVLEAWYPGMEGGNAVAEVLFGDVNPSGKLPCTFPKRLEDSPARTPDAYPGVSGTVNYTEGLLMGYRWYDTKGIEPEFPFGHGLSYTRFGYTGLTLVSGTGGVGVKFLMENTGERAGAEVAEVYVHPVAPRVMRPVKELKGFAKVWLKPGEKRELSVSLGAGAFSDYENGGWVVEPGEYEVEVGSSSRDIRLRGVVKE
jgi:beta-glucosidase